VIPSLIKIDDYLFYKIYRIGRYCSTGVIVLPPSEIKHYANVKENTLVFYVVQGEIYVTVNHYTFMAAKAGHIVIPRSSTYQLANKMDSDAILYFTHIVDPMWYQ
jgi:gentisate 1,2-dioxygenase